MAAVPVLLCLAFAGCSDRVCTPEKLVPRDLSPAEQQVVQAYNAFGLDLFRETVAGGKNENIFISPVSVSMALGMTLNGAAGTTEQAMKSTLAFGSMTIEEIDESYQGLIQLLTGLDPEVALGVANSVWYRSDMIFQEPFLDACRTYFSAEVEGLDFNDPGAADTINGWVSDKTNGKIEEIVDKPIDGAYVMFLINAIYFKGTWTYQFDPALTEDSDFRGPDGSLLPCRMMQQPEPGKTGTFLYLGTTELQAIELPYADGWFAMTVLLPREGTDLDSFIAGLTPETWNGYIEDLEEREGTIALPRFKLEYQQKLNDVLTSLGMGIAFTPGADFSRMRAGGGLWIDEVKHKTFVEVNEEGTEAAAVTSVGMVDSVPDIFQMRVDRPFVFVIRERHSGTVLFVGKIVDPGT
jgi:serine protease inhibitor